MNRQKDLFDLSSGPAIEQYLGKTSICDAVSFGFLFDSLYKSSSPQCLCSVIKSLFIFTHSSNFSSNQCALSKASCHDLGWNKFIH